MKFFEILESDDVDKLKSDSNHKSTKELYDELIKMLSSKDYEECVDFIDELVKDPKLKFILGLGFGGDWADTDLQLKKIKSPVINFIPTQSEIGFGETLKYICEDGKNVDKCFANPAIIKRPIVSFRGTFIVDGHHRWSEIYATNRNAVIESIDITGNLSPIQILKAIQATIGSNTGTLNRKDIQGPNLFDVSEKDIKTYLEKNMSKKARDILSGHYEDPIKAILENCLALKANNKPILDAPERGDMPQTSKDPDLMKDLDKGVTEI